MRDHRPTSTEELITDGNLSSLQQHATQINLINKKLVDLLPRGSAEHCRAANIRQGCLIIETASAAVKMKLDYERLNILNRLRAEGYAGLSQIEIRINPALYRTAQEENEEKVKKRPPLSDSAANSILTTASMASNPKLKARLERIAALAKKGD